ncbi:unnamed protein product, partial [marine sediment metagenome]
LNDNLTVEILEELAKTQQFVDPWFCNNLLSLKHWDSSELMYEEEQVIEFNLDDINPDIAIKYPEFPPCVQSWLSMADIEDYGKFLIVLYLKDQIVLDETFEAQDIISILKRTLSVGEFSHYFSGGRGTLPRRHGGHRGKKFHKVMEKDYYMPDCLTIRKSSYIRKIDDEWVRISYCPGDCKRRHPIYR